MLLGEPPRSQGDLNFSLFGMPVRIHPFFWLVAVLLGMRSASVAELLTWVAALFLAILFHELGHAVTMRAYGFHPSITLYGLGGLASYNDPGGYRSRGSGPLGQVLISAAGPGAGFLLAALIVAGIKLSGHQIQFRPGGSYGMQIAMDEIGSPLFTDFLFRILFISIIWGIVNLLPVYPLDGGQIAREVFLKLNPRDGIRQSLILSMITGAALAIVGLLQWGSVFVALLFGYLAFTSYVTLQGYSGRRPWQ